MLHRRGNREDQKYQQEKELHLYQKSQLHRPKIHAPRVAPNNQGLSSTQQTPSSSKDCGKQKAAKKHSAQHTTLDDSDEIWNCGLCGGAWQENGDDVWIQCDQCDVPFHLQCCGLDYDTDDYYELNIESIQFFCKDCVPSDEEEVN